MSNNNVVATSAIGTPKSLSEKHTIVASFHDFESLPHKKGDCTNSPEMTCHGHKWQVPVNPGGDMISDDGTWTSIFLVGTGGVKTNFTIRVGSKFFSTNHVFKRDDSSWGWPKFLLRSDVLDPAEGYVKDGTLKVEVDIQIWVDGPQTWKPQTNRLRNDMLTLLESANASDLSITVGNKQFLVFKALIARCAPIIGEMIASQTSETTASIAIDDVDPKLFGGLLHFIYTNEPPENLSYRKLLEVADRFGCFHLKLAAEAELVEAGVDANNAAELLLFADGHSCALLREAAFEYCAAHPLAVKESDGWNLLKQSHLCAELLGACPTQFSESDIDSMRVATLRQKLEGKGLEVDGTRETLIRRLEENGNPTSE